MQTIVLPPVTVLSSRHRTSIQQMDQLQPVIHTLYLEAVLHGSVSGPLCHIYTGADGKPDTLFNLDICIPVQECDNDSAYQLKQLPAFKAIVYRHYGKWNNLPHAYNNIMCFADQNKIAIREEFREVYLNIDNIQPENNITEIQVGIFD